MLHNKRIAILTSQTLEGIGLRSLLDDYFSPREVAIFSQGERLIASAEQFDYFIVTPELFLQHGDFFLPRKNRSVLLLQQKVSPPPSNTSSYLPYQLYTSSSIDRLTEQLEAIFTSFSHTSSGDAPEELSPREIDVLQLVVQGLINKEIAERLNISFNTVLTHRKNITTKLGIKTVSGLTFYAMMNGYISMDHL